LATRTESKASSADRPPDLTGSPWPDELTVTGVKYLHDYVFEAQFADGFRREVDMAGDLWGELFEPLQDVSVFSQVRFDPEQETAVWPNGADVAPEFLRWGPHLPHGCACGYDDPDEAEAAQKS